MSINEVLSSLLEKKIHFSSNNFRRDFRTRGFSMFNLKLCGIWLLISAGTNSKLSRVLSNLSPRITQLSTDGQVMIYAWPLDENCFVEHLC